MRKLLILCLIILSFTAKSQEVKKREHKERLWTENYEVLKSDSKIKNGSYKLHDNVGGNLRVKGQFNNNKPVGVWEYYDFSGDLNHIYDFDNKRVLLLQEYKNLVFNIVYHEQQLYTNLDSIPLIIGGFSNLDLRLSNIALKEVVAPSFPKEGKAVYTFVVSKNGGAKDFKLDQSSGNSFDNKVLEELERTSNEWLPAEYKGEKVDVNYILIMDVKSEQPNIFEAKYSVRFSTLKLSDINKGYVETKNQKGFLIGGQKVNVWEFCDENYESELKIDFKTGRVFYLKPDNSDFIIEENGDWVARKLKIYPIPLDGTVNFRSQIMNGINYPVGARLNGLQGRVAVMFEIDSTGNQYNYQIVEDIGGGCGEEVVNALKRYTGMWLPGQYNGKLVNSRFILPITFSIGEEKRKEKTTKNWPLAKELNPQYLTALGIFRSESSSTFFNSINDLADFTAGNKINHTSISAALKSTSSNKLSLVNIGFDTLSTDIEKLNKLEFLDLEGNNLTTLPATINSLKLLKELYAPNNHISKIDIDFKELQSLKILGLGDNKLTTIPESVFELPDLEALDLSNNQFTSIPAKINQLVNLKVLSFSGNNLASLPPELFELKKIKELYLSDNKLAKEDIDKVKLVFKKAKVVIN